MLNANLKGNALMRALEAGPVELWKEKRVIAPQGYAMTMSEAAPSISYDAAALNR